MMFRDTSQAALAVRVLLGCVGLADLWTEEGPAADTSAPRGKPWRRGPPRLTRDQRAAARAAWSIWMLHRPEPGRAIALPEVVAKCPAPCLRALGQLLEAMAADAPARWDRIDDWIARSSAHTDVDP